jgi:hypothetical protein
MERNYLHVLRRITQILFIFFIVFIPVLNIFRFDSATGTLIVFGNAWELGLKQGGSSADGFALKVPSLSSLIFLP